MNFERLPQVADIAQIDKDKKLRAPNAGKKKAGGRRPFPAGEVNPPPVLRLSEPVYGVSDS